MSQICRFDPAESQLTLSMGLPTGGQVTTTDSVPTGSTDRATVLSFGNYETKNRRISNIQFNLGNSDIENPKVAVRRTNALGQTRLTDEVPLDHFNDMDANQPNKYTIRKCDIFLGCNDELVLITSNNSGSAIQVSMQAKYEILRG